MEGRFEQLIVIAVVIVLSLFDLLLRRARRRARRQQAEVPEEEYDGELAFEDAAPEEVEAAGAGVEATPRPSPPLPPSAAPPLERIPARAAHSWTPPRATERLPGGAERPPRCRHRALGPGAAKRGIVLMTVLGPCRAQEMDRR